MAEGKWDVARNMLIGGLLGSAVGDLFARQSVKTPALLPEHTGNASVDVQNIMNNARTRADTDRERASYASTFGLIGLAAGYFLTQRS